MEKLKRIMTYDNRRYTASMSKTACMFLICCCLLASIYVYHDGKLSEVKLVVWNNQNASKSDNMINVPIEKMMKGPLVLEQDDDHLIQYIRTRYLVNPSEQEYNLKSPNKDPSMGQSAAIKAILGEKKKGFFVECGALDGETRSNTLSFEKDYGWSGILIEGDPKNSAIVTTKNRKAFSVPACLSTVPYPVIVKFKQSFNLGKISDHPSRFGTYTDSQCLPLYSILLAVGVTKVDYFSLDVEGNELQVLKTIPWQKVNITTLSVEFVHTEEGADSLKNYMENLGYKVHSKVTNPGNLANDFIFFHPDLL